jgi:hypothetical protein
MSQHQSMSGSAGTVAEAAEQLTQVLNQLNGALVASDVEALLAVESELQVALVAASRVAHAGDRAAGAAAIAHARVVLGRCHRLGSAFSEVARGLARISGAADGYDRAGTYVDRTGRSSWLRRA